MRRTFLALVALLASLLLTAPALAGKPGTWSRITPDDLRNIDEVGLARSADGVLHVAWHHRNGAGTEDVMHTAIAANGTVRGGSTIQAGWASLGDPALVIVPGGLRVVFGGIRTIDAGETNDNANTALSADGGVTWALQPGDFMPGLPAYGSDIGAVAGLDGTVYTAAAGTGSGVFVHAGLAPGPSGAYQGQLGGCCGYWATPAVDGRSGQVFLAWSSNATGNSGVYAQEVDRATGNPVGAPMRMPGSVTTFNGAPSFNQALSMTPATGRAGKPGVFVAYRTNYPTAKDVRVWRVGAPASTKLATTKADSDVALAADGAGRLWVVWAVPTSKGERVYARRSNPDATAWGAVVSAAAPKGAATIFHVAANAQAGPVDVVVNAGSGNAVAQWHSQIRPGLTLHAGKARKGRVTFTVTDAGVAVSGAKVTFAGRSGKTGSKGTATLKGTKGTAKASKSGYTGAGAKV